MSRHVDIQKRVLVSVTLACIAAAWWGCSASPQTQTTGSTTSVSASSGSGGSGGSGGASGTGGIGVDTDGGLDDGAACVYTAAVADRVQLDIVFLIDRSGSMTGPKWTGTKSGLTTFWNDPASAKIGAGLVYFPNWKAYSCAPEDYQVLNVPIDVLPDNAFELSNSLPADATGSGTPTYGALNGALMAATAYQDAHPTHKVILVLATDGDPTACGDTTIDDIAALAKGARNYNGVLTYVIGVQGSTIANLNKIAEAGGTTAAYDITNDINQFTAKMKEIRGAALGCEFEIPPPPDGQELDPDEVNFSYTPKGTGMPKILLRADNLDACNNQPGWYYDNANAPTKIILCPASCATVQADTKAKVEALFGCKTQIF
jgi:uncharacterized protein YegL